MTNAERQARYLEKLKARAHGTDLPERIKAALDAAYQAAWDIWTRENYGGIEDYPDWQSMRGLALAGDLVKLRDLFDLQDVANEQESRALGSALAIIDVFPALLKRRR